MFVDILIDRYKGTRGFNTKDYAKSQPNPTTFQSLKNATKIKIINPIKIWILA